MKRTNYIVLQHYQGEDKEERQGHFSALIDSYLSQISVEETKLQTRD